MPLTKVVNGIRIELSAEEEAKILRQRQIDTEQHQKTRWLYGRSKEYPELSEQLDMLWHELNAMGSIAKDGQWFQAIKAIKDKYPKPNERV